MALLDAGVPLIRPVGGISVGLVTENNADDSMKSYKMLLDIIGSEDFYGDMDFKLCGTSEGVTGYQLDLKLAGLPIAMLEEAIHIAKAGRTAILAKMAESISEPKELSAHAPRIVSVKIPQDRIGELIGPGGKNIKGIQAESGADQQQHQCDGGISQQLRSGLDAHHQGRGEDQRRGDHTRGDTVGNLLQRFEHLGVLQAYQTDLHAVVGEQRQHVGQLARGLAHQSLHVHHLAGEPCRRK
jgi:polyribonucleotide nucleotidyltransferase